LTGPQDSVARSTFFPSRILGNSSAPWNEESNGADSDIMRHFFEGEKGEERQKI
jgi:hypothetical protein